MEVVFFLCLRRRVSRFDPVGTTSGDVGTLLYRVSEDPKQAGTGRELDKI